jgi:threonine dehydratase
MDSVAADKRIRPYVHETPLQLARQLSESTGAKVYLKLENLQETGAFKLRGAANKLLSLPKEEAARGIVTPASSAFRWRSSSRSTSIRASAPASTP